MESRSLTEMKNSKSSPWILLLVILVCLLPTVFFMCMDTYRTGDEIVTYGMANEPECGWMFSKGRIRAYIDTAILGDGVSGIPGNLIAAGKDILTNRKNAAFFQMERPSETGWYTKEQMQGYTAITEGEAFHPGDIYLNGMGDDANSFLYYLCLHLVSSLFPQISATKWSGFLLNLIFLAVSLLLLYRIASRYVQTEGQRYGILVAYACSIAAVSTFTNIRPYALTIVMQEWLLLLHLKMLEAYERNGMDGARKYIRRLIPAYIVGYISHYTTGIWAVSLAVFIIVSVPKEKAFLRSYFRAGILAVFLGIVVDPMSVLGLLSKLKGTESDGLIAAYHTMLLDWIRGIFGNPIWLVPAGVLCIIAVFRFRNTDNRGLVREYLRFPALPVFYMLLSVFLMKTVKIATVLPYFFVVFGMLVFYAAGEKKLWKKILTGLCFLLWAGGMFAGLVREKKEERKDYLLLEEQMAGYNQDHIVFLRDHGAGYDKIPLLGNYERIYLWTADEGWEEYGTEAKQALQDGGLVLIDGAPEELWAEAEKLCLTDGETAEVLLQNDQFMLVNIKR